jgi:hypothetical protein
MHAPLLTLVPANRQNRGSSVFFPIDYDRQAKKSIWLISWKAPELFHAGFFPDFSLDQAAVNS